MKKILVANRGEIAMRVIRTAQQMGISTVAVLSEADRNAPHVLHADQAVFLGPAASSRSYLNMEKVIEAALSTSADAIHPGYGFLSENAVFAELVQKAGLVFIGPDPGSIRTMGSKLAAKEAVRQYDIPMIPGTDEPISDVNEAKKVAEQIGFPILVKASAGGGGKGMRIVKEPSEFASQVGRAISEAESSFGDGSVFLEKYLVSPRHVEIQILADRHGNIVHLLERECSIQRRHQKVVEEAPSTALTPELRYAMGQTAIDVARSCDYVGAGTVEFLLDRDGSYYFLEMNTRLQVEHPITEMITGIDLVRQQILIARGESLQLEQESIVPNGHAIELRIYAEDPMNNFLPDVGRLENYVLPSGEGIRVDNGYTKGMEIPIYYDPMLAKLICHAATRQGAINLMKRAIAEYLIEGVKTTLPFGRFVMDHENFISGNYSTHFVDDQFQPEVLNLDHKETSHLAALLALYFYQNERAKLRVHANGNKLWLHRKKLD